MRLPALIQTVDDKHCSLNCQLLNLGRCSARGYSEKQIEDLQRNKERTHFLRTRYCRERASNDGLVIEECLECKGQCEGESYSAHTVCTKCGTKFVRIEDQDEHYLRRVKE